MINTIKKPIFIYANSAPNIGGGHVLRQLALAQQAKKMAIPVTFIYHQANTALLQRIKSAGFQVTKLINQNFDKDISNQASLIIIDDYHLTGEQKSTLTQLSIPVVVFDDQTDQDKIIADCIINSAEHITSADYKPRSQAKQLLLGPFYRLIRDEFLARREHLKHLSERNRILITLGASDVKNLSYILVKHLLTIEPNLPIDIVIGNMAEIDKSPWDELLNSHSNLKLFNNVEDMSFFMAQSGLAITNAGGTLYELACLGVPSIALCIVDNQLSALHSTLNNSGYIAFDLREKTSQHELVLMLQPITKEILNLWQQPKQRLHMSKILQKEIDGLGSQRIIKALLALNNEY